MKTYIAPSAARQSLLRVVLFAGYSLPLAWMLAGFMGNSEGNNPVRVLLWESGEWSLYLLCITLAVTPLRLVTGWNWLFGFRRMPGMFAFFYALLHVGAYLWLARSQELMQLIARIMGSKLLFTGFLAFAIMVPLALTSTQRMFQLLGKKAWQWLHRLTYLSAILAALHYWLVKARMNETGKPMLIAIVVILLLLFRWVWFMTHRDRR